MPDFFNHIDLNKNQLQNSAIQPLAYDPEALLMVKYILTVQLVIRQYTIIMDPLG